MQITQEELRRFLRYEPDTGIFTWLVTRGAATVGAVAGCVGGDGYIHIKLRGRIYKAHRLAWLYVTGTWPEKMIDHKDGDNVNNRFGNLREATCAQNQQNARLACTNKSGVKGVHWYQGSKKWRATVRCNGVCKRLGDFSELEDAAAAVMAARNELHGEFANHGLALRPTPSNERG